MNLEARALVLMEKSDGILTEELGSYNVEEGLGYVFKAYVEEEKIKLFLSTLDDVTDEEFEKLFDEYDLAAYAGFECEIEEYDEEFNPVWILSLPFPEKHEDVEELLGKVIKLHIDQIKRILA